MKIDLFRAITKVLVQQFKNANLHMPAIGYSERVIRLLEKMRSWERAMKEALPSYSIRRSPRAKNLRLKVSREDALRVVVPKDFDEKKIPSVLKRKRDWIADSTKRIL